MSEKSIMQDRKPKQLQVPEGSIEQGGEHHARPEVNRSSRDQRNISNEE
jgi:hypothetical protein